MNSQQHAGLSSNAVQCTEEQDGAIGQSSEGGGGEATAKTWKGGKPL